MSMATYPFLLYGAFLVDEEVAAHMMLKHDKENNVVPPEIWDLVCSGEFNAKARQDTLPGGYGDLDIAYEIYENEMCRVGEFDGDVDPTLPSKTDVTCREYSDDVVYYFPAKQEVDLFNTAYNSPEELLSEHKETLHDLGVNLPDDFDWWGHIVDICGTYFC